MTYTFRDLSGECYSCEDCKHNDKEWYEMPCDACCGGHCGYEPGEENTVERCDQFEMRGDK